MKKPVVRPNIPTSINQQGERYAFAADAGVDNTYNDISVLPFSVTSGKQLGCYARITDQSIRHQINH